MVFMAVYRFWVWDILRKINVATLPTPVSKYTFLFSIQCSLFLLRGATLLYACNGVFSAW